jgi:hypothetical protein
MIGSFGTRPHAPSVAAKTLASTTVERRRNEKEMSDIFVILRKYAAGMKPLETIKPASG